MDEAAEPAVAKLAALLKDPDANVRIQAARVLVTLQLQPKAAAPAPIAALSDSSAGVRTEAGRVLADLNPDPVTAIPALIDAMSLDRRDPDRRGLVLL